MTKYILPKDRLYIFICKFFNDILKILVFDIYTSILLLFQYLLIKCKYNKIDYSFNYIDLLEKCENIKPSSLFKRIRETCTVCVRRKPNRKKCTPS